MRVDSLFMSAIILRELPNGTPSSINFSPSFPSIGGQTAHFLRGHVGTFKPHYNQGRLTVTAMKDINVYKTGIKITTSK